MMSTRHAHGPLASEAWPTKKFHRLITDANAGVTAPRLLAIADRQMRADERSMMANSILLAQKKANESLTDLPDATALLVDSTRTQAVSNTDGRLVRQLTPASILSTGSKGKSGQTPDDLGSALSEVGKLRNEIAGMEAVLQAVKGALHPPWHCESGGASRATST